jgi:hypothetical protein
MEKNINFFLFYTLLTIADTSLKMDCDQLVSDYAKKVDEFILLDTVDTNAGLVLIAELRDARYTCFKLRTDSGYVLIPRLNLLITRVEEKFRKPSCEQA